MNGNLISRLPERDQRWLEQPDHHLIALDDPRYPSRLREIASPPAALFARGDLDLLNRPQIAIVGSRAASPEGRREATGFAAELAEQGLCITSGLASGIDAAAHRGALDARGMTIAVFGTGPDRVYPAANRGLAHEIAASGLIVSEFPCGSPPRRGHFPKRNRIVSGLSLGVLVVEAAEASGSLISARSALEQGREVFAIPGSIRNPRKRGCHRLIREGARLVETPAEILEEIAPLLDNGRFAPRPFDAGATAEAAKDPDYGRLLSELGYEPVPLDVLVARTGLAVEAVSSMLLMLELDGIVEPVTGGAYLRRDAKEVEQRDPES